jgi:hypothetical protein
MSDHTKEMDLEVKYTNVLQHKALKDVLSGYPVTATAVGNAIKAFCKAEKVKVPSTFEDAEIFANDVYDHWADVKPGYHEGRSYEKVLEGIKRYLAAKFIWQYKVDNNTAEIPMLQLQASSMLTVKSALGAAVISAHSHTKSDPRLPPGQLAEAMEMAFETFLPVIHKLQTNGKLDNPKVKHLAEIIHKEIESERFKQLEWKESDDQDKSYAA